jgi:hypothetical protein
MAQLTAAPPILEGIDSHMDMRDARSGCGPMRRIGESRQCLCNGDDEQLRFVSDAGVPMSYIDYRITLSDGELWQGSTDADGRTERIGSKAAAAFDRVECIARPKEGLMLLPRAGRAGRTTSPRRSRHWKSAMYSPRNTISARRYGRLP